jgi:predicted AlkP superfamily phosphohydrolase/phosphomutase
MAGRLLFIGLDAGDVDLIETWAAEGLLPNISRLKAGGTWARIRTTAEHFHVSAWPSTFTGTTADKHGLYHAYVVRPGHQGLLRPRPDESPFPFVWKLLSDHGKRSVVIDAFLTCPVRDFHGVQIVDWGSWSWFWTPTMVPSSLKHEIHRRFGPYPADDHSKIGMTPVTDIAAFRHRLLAAVSRKTDVVKWLLQREAWDFFLVVFGESHPAGHYFWHLHDPAYVTHPADHPGGLQYALRDVYIALDRAIGDLLTAVDRDTTVWLVSGDGMVANYSGSHLLPDLLTRMGLLSAAPAPGRGSADAASEDARGRRDLLSAARNMVPERWRIAVSQALLSRRMQEQLSLRWKTAGIAWPETRAFVIENANEGYVRINLRGREPAGIVSAGAEYAELCRHLCQTARTMTNPVTRQRAALDVVQTDDLFDGPRRSYLPDVVIVWNPEARVTTELLTEQYDIVRVAAPGCAVAPFYSGNHWPNAFVGAVGPRVAQGGLEDGSILDLAPSILAHFGIDPPDYMDGRVRRELGSA